LKFIMQQKLLVLVTCKILLILLVTSCNRPLIPPGEGGGL
jgi:hypothetical protein